MVSKFDLDLVAYVKQKNTQNSVTSPSAMCFVLQSIDFLPDYNFVESSLMFFLDGGG